MAPIVSNASADRLGLATKSDVAALRTDLAEFKAEIFRFMLVQTAVIVGVTTGLTVTLVRLLGT